MLPRSTTELHCVSFAGLAIDFMKLYNLGGDQGLMVFKGLAPSGAWVWWFKDRIDRKFVNAFNADKLPKSAHVHR